MVGGREKASKGSASNRRFYISLYQIGAGGVVVEVVQGGFILLQTETPFVKRYPFK